MFKMRPVRFFYLREIPGVFLLCLDGEIVGGFVWRMAQFFIQHLQKLPPCSMLSRIFLIYWENAELWRGSWQSKKLGQQEKKALLTTTRTILVLLTSQKLGQAKAMDCCVCLHWPLPQTKCQVTWLTMQGARSFFVETPLVVIIFHFK